MQSESPQKNKATELELILDRWEQRYEWQLLSRTAPRSLIAALLISLIIGAVGYFRFRLTAEQLALIAAGLCALGGILNLLYTLLFPRKREVRARYFDIEFGLQERISTAFELMHGRIKTHPEIEARQIADALAHARAIDPSERIAMDFRRRELGVLAVLLVAMVGMILLPAIVGEDFRLDRPSAAVEAAKEDLREIIETVAKDTDLDDVDRQELLEALEIALERLEEEDISEEEAFAAMSQLQAQLEALENKLEDTIELDQSKKEAALEALEDFIAPSETEGQRADSARESSALQEMLRGLEQLSQAAAQMSAQEAQAAAEALQKAAEELAQMSPEMAEQLQALAEALREGDLESLQEQMDALREQLSQEQRQQQRDQNARMMMQAQSELAQDAAEAIAQRQSQEGQQEAGDPQQGQPQESESGQQRGGRQSDQESPNARQVSNRGAQQADRNRPGSGENPGRNQDTRSSGGGAGEGAPSNVSLAGSGGEDQGAETDNRTTGLGEIEYEAIYSPSGVGGGGDNEIRLRTDPGDTTVAEGEFDDNPVGESRVSYDTVFSEYQNAANRALESDYVPLGLRDVVREYFTSLDPSAQG